MKPSQIIQRAMEISNHIPTKEENQKALQDLKQLKIDMMLDFEFMEAVPWVFETIYKISTEEKEQWKKDRREYLELNI